MIDRRGAAEQIRLIFTEKGLLHLGITEKERRCRKTRYLRSKFYIFSFLIISFLRLKFYEFLLFYALFLSSLALAEARSPSGENDT